MSLKITLCDLTSCRAGPSLSAFNYDSNYGKKALTMMYRGIMEQDAFPVVPLGCSESQANLEEFITKAKAALVSVGIIRDPVMCKLFYKHFYCCKIKSMNFGKFYFVCVAIKISCSTIQS